MHNSSGKWGHLENLDLQLNKHNFSYQSYGVIWHTLSQTQQTQFSLPTLWGHLAHFELGSIFHNYHNLNCELVP